MKTLQEILARLAALDVEIREAKDMEAIETLAAEKKDLLERKAVLEGFEERKANALGMTLREIPGQTLEVRNAAATFDKETVASSPEYRSAFLKRLQGKELSEIEERAYSTATNYGEEVIPTATGDKVIQKVYQVAPVLEHMVNLFHVPGGLKWGVEGTNNDAAKHTENAAITPAADTLSSISLGAFEVTKALRASRTVLAMSTSAFEDFIVILLASNVARKLEAIVFAGTGTGEGTGLVKAGAGTSGAYTDGTDQVSVNAATAVTEADALSWYSMIDGYADVKAYMSKATFLAYFYPLMNVGKNISVKYQDGRFYIMDAPVFFTNTLTKGVGYLAAMEMLYGNFAEDINVRKSEASGFLNNSIDFLGVCAFDCKPVVGVSAFAKFVKAQS